jgi:hypothetical protein
MESERPRRRTEADAILVLVLVWLSVILGICIGYLIGAS